MTELKFGERIKRIRATQKLTQQAFADKVGVSKATVNSWENNGKFPAVDTAAKIADAFGVSLDWLCGIEDKAARKMETYGDLFAALISFCTAFRCSSVRFSPACQSEIKFATIFS